ncbi:DUF6942 family protein [Pseudoalteromonas xiamenensis]
MDRIGFGIEHPKIAVYVEHKPKIAGYIDFGIHRALEPGEIQWIGQEAGNGWRKQFNVFAKLLNALNHPAYTQHQLKPWQSYRDQHLLQATGKEAYLFSPPVLNEEPTIHLIAGRTYAKKLLDQQLVSLTLIWLDDEFAIDTEHRVIVCPFFDYRQLSNIKIERLCELIRTLY